MVTPVTHQDKLSGLVVHFILLELHSMHRRPGIDTWSTVTMGATGWYKVISLYHFIAEHESVLSETLRFRIRLEGPMTVANLNHSNNVDTRRLRFYGEWPSLLFLFLSYSRYASGSIATSQVVALGLINSLNVVVMELTKGW
jgi:hypothetical protein